jgi:hypothetical protein
MDRFDHPAFVPGAAKYQDLPGLMALCAPTKLWLADGDEPPAQVVTAAYAASHATSNLTIISDKGIDLKKSAAQ